MAKTIAVSHDTIISGRDKTTRPTTPSGECTSFSTVLSVNPVDGKNQRYNDTRPTAMTVNGRRKWRWDSVSGSVCRRISELEATSGGNDFDRQICDCRSIRVGRCRRHGTSAAAKRSAVTHSTGRHKMAVEGPNLTHRRQQLSTSWEIAYPGIDGSGGVTRRTAPEGRTRDGADTAEDKTGTEPTKAPNGSATVTIDL
ncbi:hypothetical protein QTP88_023787 [Uroleucon formosanum]